MGRRKEGKKEGGGRKKGRKKEGRREGAKRKKWEFLLWHSGVSSVLGALGHRIDPQPNRVG